MKYETKYVPLFEQFVEELNENKIWTLATEVKARLAEADERAESAHEFDQELNENMEITLENINSLLPAKYRRFTWQKEGYFESQLKSSMSPEELKEIREIFKAQGIKCTTGLSRNWYYCRIRRTS